MGRLWVADRWHCGGRHGAAWHWVWGSDGAATLFLASGFCEELPRIVLGISSIEGVSSAGFLRVGDRAATFYTEKEAKIDPRAGVGRQRSKRCAGQADKLITSASTQLSTPVNISQGETDPDDSTFKAEIQHVHAAGPTTACAK